MKRFKRIVGWTIVVMGIFAMTQLIGRSATERAKQPPVIYANGDVTNVTLMEMAQVNAMLSGEVPNNDLERERRQKYQQAVHQMILNRYGDGPYQIVLATNGQQKLVLEYPAMTYRLIGY